MTRLTIDELETLTPDQLGELLINAVCVISPDIMYIQDLLDVGCPIDYKSDYGWTPLHYAAMDGALIVVKFLLSKGADIHTRDDDGWTALHWAACDGNNEVIKFLISKGADIYIKGENLRTAWDVAPIEIKKAIPELKPK